MTFAVQSGYLFNILIIAFPKMSYPLAEFNLPTKDINFSFLLKLTFFLFIDC